MVRSPVFFLITLLLTSRLSAQIDWPTLSFELITTNQFSFPTCITHSGDGSGRLFVAEQDGTIRVLQSTNTPPTLFLEITNQILRGGERGLLGLAFAPGFITNHHFYVNYTRKPDGATVISRFSVGTDSGLADPHSEQVLKIITQPFPNHNGGHLAFGPDGYLYIGMGDGGYASPALGDPGRFAQRPNSLLGKILRIDVQGNASSYGIPSDNPFVGDTNYAPEIWAMGLRNPWRFSFDRSNGDLYIGDVGHSSLEEINFQPGGSPGGQNYGWRLMEGTNIYRPESATNFSYLTLPIAWYDRLAVLADGAASVTGGYVYRGPAEPRLNGTYLFGDFISGQIWGLKRQGTNWLRSELEQTGFGISTFGEDELGRLYIADYYRGRVYQVSDSHKVRTPSFSPAGGIINSNTVRVTCDTPDALIHYRADGQDPTQSDPSVISGSLIVVRSGETNRVRAFRQDLGGSEIANAVFNLKVATPVFSPPTGPITNGTPVYISTVTPGASIFYTTNGDTPSSNALLYEGSVILNGNMVLKGLAVADGYANSAVQTVLFGLANVATPVFMPDAAVYPVQSNAVVSISNATPGAKIYYTLDGTDPTTNSLLYTAPLSLLPPVSLRARAYNDGWGQSPLKSSFYGLVDFHQTVVTTLAGSITAGFSNGLGALAKFSSPRSICIAPDGNLYVGDCLNYVIRKVTKHGEVTTFAGSGVFGSENYQDGAAATAQFAGINGICADSRGNFYIAESDNWTWRIRKIDTNMMVSTIVVRSPGTSGPWQAEVDPGGNIYTGYLGLQRVTPSGAVTVLSGAGDGGVGIDSITNIYASTDREIWKVEHNGSQQLYAGGEWGFTDGPRSTARFETPRDIFVDSGTNLLVSQLTRVRRIDRNGWVSTMAGSGEAGYVNGAGSLARFNDASGLCADVDGNVYVADMSNNCIRKISPDIDQDGIPDTSEGGATPFLVGIDDSSIDTDHDGMSNSAEFYAGTNAADPASYLAIAPIKVANDGAELRWRTTRGRSYVLKYSDDSLIWNILGASVVGDGSVLTVIDAGPLAVKRMYRVFIE